MAKGYGGTTQRRCCNNSDAYRYDILFMDLKYLLKCTETITRIRYEKKKNTNFLGVVKVVEPNITGP